MLRPPTSRTFALSASLLIPCSENLKSQSPNPHLEKNKRFHSILNPLSQDTQYDISIFNLCPVFFKRLYQNLRGQLSYPVSHRPAWATEYASNTSTQETDGGRQICVSEASMVYRVSLQTAGATQGNLISKNSNHHQQNQPWSLVNDFKETGQTKYI